jgi:hypothetical protein
MWTLKATRSIGLYAELPAVGAVNKPFEKFVYLKSSSKMSSIWQAIALKLWLVATLFVYLNGLVI